MNIDFPSTAGTAPQDAPAGRLDAPYLAFLATLTELRPTLHRYCARMTGSVVDGEDVVQEALVEVYRKLHTFDQARPLKPWLFRIAHNRCIDFLRRRSTREQAEAKVVVGETDFTSPVEPVGHALGKAVEHLVLTLPPKERACVLLKEVFDYTLEEIADLVDSTVGGVKAALHRGRTKLADQPIGPSATRASTPEDTALLRLYVERFNQRDWVGVRDLIAADAQLLVVDRYAGLLKASPYFGIYEGLGATWRLAFGHLDGETTIIIQETAGERWIPRAAVRLQISVGKIVAVTDYWLCPWIVSAASSVVFDNAS